MTQRHATHSSPAFFPSPTTSPAAITRGADADDLQQVASLGLLKAIDRFDPERGLAFTSFAVPTILGELKRYFRDHGWTVRVPRDVQELTLRVDTISQTLTGELGRSPTPAELAERANATTEQILEALAAATAHHPDSLDQPLSDDGDDAIDFLAAKEPGFDRVEDAAFVDGLLNTLSDRERIILRLRFENDLTQAEIGDRLGISQMHVSRLIRQAITTLQTTTAADQRRPTRPLLDATPSSPGPTRRSELRRPSITPRQIDAGSASMRPHFAARRRRIDTLAPPHALEGDAASVDPVRADAVKLCGSCVARRHVAVRVRHSKPVRRLDRALRGVASATDLDVARTGSAVCVLLLAQLLSLLPLVPVESGAAKVPTLGTLSEALDLAPSHLIRAASTLLNSSAWRLLHKA